MKILRQFQDVFFVTEESYSTYLLYFSISHKISKNKETIMKALTC